MSQPALWVHDTAATSRRAGAAYEQRRYHARKNGTWEPFTDTGPVRERLDALRAAGHTMADIATHAGVSMSTISRAYRATRMSTPAANALLATPTPDGAPPNRGAAATAHLRALVGDGWPVTAVAEETGLSERTIHRLLTAANQPHESTSRSIDQAHRDLRDEDPGDHPAAVRARARAHRAGWTPATPVPIDDLDEVAISKALEGEPVTLNPAERQAALRELAGRHPDADIAARLGLSSRTVLRLRGTHSLPAYHGPHTSPAQPSPAP